MTQSTLAIPNEAGASFRADNNTALQANATFQAGSSAPGTTYADQYWYDTTAQVLKKRNQANSAWIVIGTRDEAFMVSRSSNTILGLSDYGKTFVATSTFTQTLTAAATLGDGWYVTYRNDGTGTITVDPNSSETIDGASVLVMYPGDSCIIRCNGSAFKTIGMCRNAFANVTEIGNSGTAETDLMSFVLTANSFAVNARALEIEGWGRCANTGTTKNLRLYVGATMILGGTGGLAANAPWKSRLLIGRTGSNAQEYYAETYSIATGSIVPISARGTLSFTDSSDVTIKYTGQDSAASNGVLQEGLVVKRVGSW